MEFSIETTYDHMTLTTIAKVLRKVYRKRKSFFFRLFAVVFVLFGAYMSTPLGGRPWSFSPTAVLSYFSLLMLLICTFFEDSVNGLLAKKRISEGKTEIFTEFTKDGFTLQSDVDTTQWRYDGIRHLIETRYFYVFVYSERHAQIFEKETLAGGTHEEFEQFIHEMTGQRFRKA